MNTDKHKNNLLLMLVCVLIALVAVLGYMVFQTNARLESLVASKEPAAITSSTEEEDTTAQTPESESAEVDDLWDPFSTPFDPAHWDPFSEMDDMHRHIDAMFNDAFGRFGKTPGFGDLLGDPAFTPRMNLVDEGDHYVITLDVPGAEESEINVSMEDQTLTVEATSKVESEQNEEDQTIRRERRTGKFHRAITLPEPVDAASMETDYSDGVLTITVQKTDGQQQ